MSTSILIHASLSLGRFVTPLFHKVFAFYSSTLVYMGGERASKTRQRLLGKICCLCGQFLDSPPWPILGYSGERICDKCRPVTRRVYMSFFQRQGWTVQFIEDDCKTLIGRIRKFPDETSIRALIDRTQTKLNTEDRQALDYAFSNGRGGLYLTLTAEQYRKLK